MKCDKLTAVALSAGVHAGLIAAVIGSATSMGGHATGPLATLSLTLPVPAESTPVVVPAEPAAPSGGTGSRELQAVGAASDSPAAQVQLSAPAAVASRDTLQAEEVRAPLASIAPTQSTVEAVTPTAAPGASAPPALAAEPLAATPMAQAPPQADQAASAAAGGEEVAAIPHANEIDATQSAAAPQAVSVGEVPPQATPGTGASIEAHEAARVLSSMSSVEAESAPLAPETSEAPKEALTSILPPESAQLTPSDAPAVEATHGSDLAGSSPSASISPVADPSATESVAMLEASPLPGPPVSATIPLTPDLSRAAWREQIRGFLRTYDGGPCFFADTHPTQGSGVAIDSFSAAPGNFAVLDWAFKTKLRIDPAILGQRIWSAQCAAVDLLRETARDAEQQSAPIIELQRSDLHGNDRLAGQILDLSDRPLGLFIITETGMLFDITGSIARHGAQATFAVQPPHPVAGGPFPQILIAVTTRIALPANPTSIDVLFRPLLARSGSAPSVAARLFLLTR